jgi:A/G-specific adenine glycosylase
MPENSSVESPNFINIGIIQNNNGEVLMIKRVKEEVGAAGSKLTWAFPGGKQKEGESRKESVEREVQAETGYEVIYVREISLRIPPDLPIIIVYHLLRLKSPEQKQPEQPEEVSEIRWVKPEEIKNLITTSLDPQVAKELKIA